MFQNKRFYVTNNKNYKIWKILERNLKTKSINLKLSLEEYKLNYKLYILKNKHSNKKKMILKKVQNMKKLNRLKMRFLNWEMKKIRKFKSLKKLFMIMLNNKNLLSMLLGLLKLRRKDLRKKKLIEQTSKKRKLEIIKKKVRIRVKEQILNSKDHHLHILMQRKLDIAIS